MNGVIDLFSKLGCRLSHFGEDTFSRDVIARASECNGWFSPRDVRRAVDALCCEMLQREKLEAWLGNYKVPAVEPRSVLVVMAGNIPLVGFFDLLCVLAAGHHCMVKPAVKDLVLFEYIMGLLKEIDPDVPLSLYAGERADAVIATGSDNANRYFRSRFVGVPSLLRGSRHSVAVLSGRETRRQLQGLADDVFAYSGLGCRSVSLVFMPRGCDLRLELPPVNDKYYNNYMQTKALLEMSNTPFVDLGSAVMVEQYAFSSALSRINYVLYDDLSEVEVWLSEHDNELQCVVSECLNHSRRAEFGCAQSPALTDYPDDRDVIRFLLEI